MSVIDAPLPSMMEQTHKVVETEAAPQESFAYSARAREELLKVWEERILKKLDSWEANPSCVEDDGVIAPSPRVIRLAADYARQMRDEARLPPKRVVPNGDGGIVFERWQGTDSETLEFLDDGTVELAAFSDCKLIARTRLN